MWCSLSNTGGFLSVRTHGKTEIANLRISRLADKNFVFVNFLLYEGVSESNGTVLGGWRRQK